MVEKKERDLRKLEALLNAHAGQRIEELAHTPGFKPVEIHQPLVLVAQVQRSGGTLLGRLFDGHPEIHAYPHELNWGDTAFDWPEVRPRDKDPELWFRSMTAGQAAQLQRFSDEGYAKPGSAGGPSGLPFTFNVALQRRLFVDAARTLPPRTRRGILDLYLGSFFGAWLDYHDRYRSGKRVVTAFGKRHNLPHVAASFFKDYPDGHMVTVVRDPVGWFASAQRHIDGKYPDPATAMVHWEASTRASMKARRKWGDRVTVVGFSDLVRSPRETMASLAKRLGIADHATLTKPTFNGIPVPSNSSFRSETGIDAEAASRQDAVPPGARAEILARCGGLYEESRRAWLRVPTTRP